MSSPSNLSVELQSSRPIRLPAAGTLITTEDRAIGVLRQNPDKPVLILVATQEEANRVHEKLSQNRVTVLTHQELETLQKEETEKANQPVKQSLLSGLVSKVKKFQADRAAAAERAHYEALEEREHKTQAERRATDRFWAQRAHERQEGDRDAYIHGGGLPPTEAEVQRFYTPKSPLPRQHDRLDFIHGGGPPPSDNNG